MPWTPDVTSDLELALELADVADGISLARFRAPDLAVESKADGSPVTEVDTAIERAMREHLARHRPGDAFLGEEFGGEEGARRWVVDPIDGTRSYLRGLPGWATLIALQRDGEVVTAVASAPAAGGRFWAARAQGAYRDGRPIHVSKVGDLAAATMMVPSLGRRGRTGLESRWVALADRCFQARAYGNALTHLYVAAGMADIGLGAGGRLWDYAPFQLIIEEAGGVFTDVTGAPRADTGSAVSTNGILHPAVLEALVDPALELPLD